MVVVAAWMAVKMIVVLPLMNTWPAAWERAPDLMEAAVESVCRRVGDREVCKRGKTNDGKRVWVVRTDGR